MGIKIGGEQYVPTERPENAVPIEHVTFQAYDEMCRMATAREEAIYLWEAEQELLEQMQAFGPDHPKYEGAVRRLSALQGAITNACTMYLAAEKRADLCWQEVTPEKREELKMDDMFGVQSDRDNLFGLWYHNLPITEQPPQEFRMDEIALLIAVEPQRRVYEEMKNEG